MTQEQLAALLKAIELKNSWGKNELKDLILKILIKKEIESLQQQLAASQAREAKLREALIIASESIYYWGMYAPDYSQQKWNLGGDIQAAKDAAAMPTDDTALREANEAYLNASPEMELLNQIGRFLEDVEYKRSYLDGIIAYGKQERQKVLLEAIKRVIDGMEGHEDADYVLMKLRRMAEEIKDEPT